MKKAHIYFWGHILSAPFLVLSMEKKEQLPMPSLKELALAQVSKKLCRLGSDGRQILAKNIPHDLEESLCYSIKELKWDHLKELARHETAEHGTRAVLNYTNSQFAGIDTKCHDQVCVSTATDYTTFCCLNRKGIPVKMVAWHPLKNMIAVVQKGLWFFTITSNLVRQCPNPLRNNDPIKKIAWDDSGKKFFVAGSKQIGIWTENFWENDSEPLKIFTFPDTFPNHHYDVLEDVRWNPSGNLILAWQRSGGKRGYLDNKKHNALFVLDTDAWKFIRKIALEPTVEFHGVIDDSSVLVSRFGRISRLCYTTDHPDLETEYVEAVQAEGAFWNALHISRRYLLIERKKQDATVLQLYDRELKKSFMLPLFLKGLLQLSIDKKLAYGNDSQDDTINLSYITEQCTLLDLLSHLPPE